MADTTGALPSHSSLLTKTKGRGAQAVPASSLIGGRDKCHFSEDTTLQDCPIFYSTRATKGFPLEHTTWPPEIDGQCHMALTTDRVGSSTVQTTVVISVLWSSLMALTQSLAHSRMLGYRQPHGTYLDKEAV